MGVWGKGTVTHKEIDWPRSVENKWCYCCHLFCGQDISFLVFWWVNASWLYTVWAGGDGDGGGMIYYSTDVYQRCLKYFEPEWSAGYKELLLTY